MDIITLIQHIIHGNFYDDAEDWFVERTNPLYQLVIAGIIGFVLLVAIGVTANVMFDFKVINLAFWIISMVFILMTLTYGRNIFRVGVAGAAYGAAKSGISGLEAGKKLLQEWMRFGFILMAIVTGVFGLLMIISFSWGSAGFGIIGGTFLAVMHLASKKA